MELLAVRVGSRIPVAGPRRTVAQVMLIGTPPGTRNGPLPLSKLWQRFAKKPVTPAMVSNSLTNQTEVSVAITSRNGTKRRLR